MRSGLLSITARALALGGSSVLCMSSTPPPSRSAAASASAAAAKPLFQFGVIADVQWADAEDGYNFDKTVVRCYRGAFRNLVRAVDWWRELPSPPNFIAQLGDILDGINVKLNASQPALGACIPYYYYAGLACTSLHYALNPDCFFRTTRK